MPECKPERGLLKQTPKTQQNLQRAIRLQTAPSICMRGPTENNARPEQLKKPDSEEEEEEEPHAPKTARLGNINHVRGRQRQPKAAGENAKGTLSYEKETKTRQFTQCGKIYSNRRTRSRSTCSNTHGKYEDT